MRESVGSTKPKGAMKVKAGPSSRGGVRDWGRIPGLEPRAHYRPLWVHPPRRP